MRQRVTAPGTDGANEVVRDPLMRAVGSQEFGDEDRVGTSDRHTGTVPTANR